MTREEAKEKVDGLIKELQALHKDKIGMDDYESQMLRYQKLLFGMLTVMASMLTWDQKD